MESPRPKLATFRKSRAVRLAAHDYASDTPLHLIIGAHAGSPFSDDPVARAVCEAIEKTVTGLKYDLYAYCVMPDHLHVLLSPSDSGVDASVFLQRMKSYTTRRYQVLRGRPKLWQRSARDRILRVNEPVRVLAEYIANNPVRKSLVTDWQAWPYTKVNTI